VKSKPTMQPVTNSFKRVIAPLQTFLSKLKVFHQILLIISVMVFFLGLEGYLGLRLNLQTRDVTHQVFQVSFSGFQDISAANEELNKIRKQYSDSLLYNQTLLINSTTIDMLVKNYSKDVPDLKSEYDKIKVFSGKTASKDNYDEFNNALSIVSLGLHSLQHKMEENALQIMGNSNNFFADSQITSIILLIISLLISISIGLLVAAMISGPLKEMKAKVNALAMGDLTQTLNSKGCQEMNQVVLDFNHAVESLRQLVGGINEHAQMLALASNELREASANSGRAAGEVATVIEELTKASSEQAKQVEQTATTINELGELVRTVSGNTTNMASMSQKIAASASVGQKVTGDVASGMSNLYETTQKIHSVIGEMNQTSSEINEVASLIGSVSEQTSLLALNAAIEAARAGEHGKGFSVVAVETGKLADQSKQASQKISNLIDQMIGRSENAAEVIKEGLEQAQESSTLTTQATGTFQSIFKELGEVLNKISEVAESAQQMAERNDAMIGAVTQLSAISEEGMASTEEVAASIEEQSAGAEEVASLAENLADLADKLKQSTNTFKI
jgi:methyl-accepting chemotaxis protein